MATVQTVDTLRLVELQPLLTSSIEEGYSFVQRLWDEYQAGINRFDQCGACLLATYEESQLIAIGGVHPDPYLNDAAIGRIRHVYVLPVFRRTGIGGELVKMLMAGSAGTFRIFTLRTMTDHGQAFYTRLGFSDVPRFEQATHWLEFSAG